MKVEDILVGSVKEYKKENGELFKSAYIRKPIKESSIFLHKNGFKYDEVADLKNHGGEAKTILLFSKEDYSSFEIGTFSENIVLSSFENILVGDKFQIGEAVIEITQTREPCWKVSYFYGKDALKYMVDSGKTGLYAKVLKEGLISKKDSMEKI